MQLTPINIAEAVIEPFWDPQLSGLKKWRVESAEGCGARVRQNWCWSEFEWARKPVSGTVLRMTRECNINCSNYDTLLVSVMAPQGAVVRVSADTDKGKTEFTAPPALSLKKELEMPLKGAHCLNRLTLEVEAGAPGPAAGWFNWIGLRNTPMLEQYLAQDQRFDADWEGYLKPESYEPKYEPVYGLLINADELVRLRKRHAEYLARHGTTPFLKEAQLARRLAPEKLIGDFVNFWGDTRYNRERDHGKYILTNGMNAVIAGLLSKDKELLRLAARYCMSLAMCRYWDDGMICHFPGSAFDHRCFVQSLCAYETALILDLAGEWFTDLGRELVMRRIAEEGLACINYNTWRWEYIFHCNQMAWFTPGRMLGYLLLERSRPRVKPYIEIARKNLLECLNNMILPDGGCVEGPSYFQCVSRDGGLSLYLYARSRGLSYEEVIPESMKRCAAFSAAVRSTDNNQDQIPICDAGSMHPMDSLAIMAMALPESEWVDMFWRGEHQPPRVAYENGARAMDKTLLTWILDEKVPKKVFDPVPFVFLPDMGIMSSTRKIGEATVKLFIMGNKAGAGHTHEDKGSFVLEFAGETFAMDPGSCDYSNPMAGLLKNCERHNMLVPYGLEDRPHPQNPLPQDVRPVGEGDAVRFHAEINATPGWKEYIKWKRGWDSPAPDMLIISDQYELHQGEGVEFYWNTKLPVGVDGRLIRIRGKRGVICIETPADCEVRIDRLPMFGGEIQNRIVIRKGGIAGELRVVVRLSIGKENAL